jgi:hypothetical protein
MTVIESAGNTSDPPPLAEFSFPIERGQVLVFARAIGASEDAECVRDGIAPLTFTAAADHFDPDCPRRPRPSEPWPNERSGAAPGFHAEQHFVYHRHPQVGETLVARPHPGATWTREGKRGGRLSFHEVVTDYLDSSGMVVISARRVTCTTERIAL